MAKLFAFEEMEENLGSSEVSSVSEDELDAISDIPETQEETGELTEHAEAVDEAVDAAGDLDEVQEVVEKSIEEEGGLSPVAAEAVRIAVESICARIGASPKGLFSLYATENYKSSSARLANSKLALEGIMDFLRELWEKIKKAVKGLWDKLVAFWEKHISKLGRDQKALEAAYERVGRLSGSPKESEVKAPGSLAKDFCFADSIDKALIIEYIEKHNTEIAKLTNFVKASKALNDSFKVMEKKKASELDLATIQSSLEAFKSASAHLSLGSADKPLLTGVWFEIDEREETVGDEKLVAFNLKEEHISEKKEDQKFVVIPSPSDMRELIVKAKGLIKVTVNEKKSVSEAEKLLKETFKTIDNVLSKVEKEAKDKEDVKKQISNLRSTLELFHKFQAAFVKVSSTLLYLNRKLISDVVVAINVSERQFEKK
jgi:hypothetical protein